ncbi:MAG: carboxypeptidase-like regulatory domain-containing protein [Pyrinomonadaceae bacterium]
MTQIRSLRNATGTLLAGIFVLSLFAFAVSAQAPPNPIPAQQVIPSGSLIIPMDNYHQGNAAQTTFNLRAYGLVNALLQNNIPVKWAIKPNKSKDATDFSANVTRITAGPTGDPGPSVANFSGGPFIVSAEFDTPSVRTLINNFNTGNPTVTVYQTNANVSVDVRYTLMHKPKIAIGPDSGNFGQNVNQAVFNAAGISNYTIVDNSIINANSCFTLATQAHSTDPQFVNLYRNFAQSGGNLLLQCASIQTYENNANGHFQTTPPGYSIFGTGTPSFPTGPAIDTPLIYPAGSMPFNQFIDILANQDGAITEYEYAPGGGPVNGNLVSVHNSAGQEAKFVATVSQLNGPSSVGGAVFELGGHDYARNNTNASNIAKLNGQRMILNTAFVPVTRPCGVQGPSVIGFKSVRRFNVRNGGFPLIAGDILEWTIDYINNSPVDITGFQIQDIIQPGLTLDSPGAVTLGTVSGGASATLNPGYDGIGNDATSNLLATGFLPVNGRIQVRVRTRINLGLPSDTILRNQTAANGLNLASTTNSDNIDATNTSIFGPGDQPPPDSILQPQDPNSIDPTIARIMAAPTAASGTIEGFVRNANGAGISKAVITVVNATTGATSSVRTNSLGAYRFEGLEIGSLFLVSVQHKQYNFPNSSVTFTLSDNITGLSFVGNLIVAAAVAEPARSATQIRTRR